MDSMAAQRAIAGGCVETGLVESGVGLLRAMERAPGTHAAPTTTANRSLAGLVAKDAAGSAGAIAPRLRDTEVRT